jgi:hypothetical protein
MKRKAIMYSFLALVAASSIIAAFLPVNSFTPSPQFSADPISEEEKQGLIYMREEEKLARDVYLKMLEKYNARVFDNISGAEQRHMDFVKEMLDKFSVVDPVTNNDPGIFSNSDIAAQYIRLVEQGNISLIDALKAGAEIEDMDIADLNKHMSKVTNEDIMKTYKYLKRGSENHLRAFMRNLDRRGGTYEPIYLSKTEFDDILNVK